MNKRRRRAADEYIASRRHPFLDLRPPSPPSPRAAAPPKAPSPATRQPANGGWSAWREAQSPATRQPAPGGWSAWREAQMSGELLALQQRLKAPRRRSDASRRLPWIVGIALVVIAGVPLVMRSWPAAQPQPSGSVTGATTGTPDTASTNIPVETLSVAPAMAPDEDTVRDRLAQYASAYASLSVLKTADVWPSVDREALGQAFAALRSVDLRFDRCDVDVAGVRATARCAGILTYVRRIGSSGPITAKQAWLFDLRRSDGDWLIQQVSSSLGQGLP